MRKGGAHGPVFVLAGNARREKGFDLLPGAIQHYYRHGGSGSFIIQAIDSWEQETGRDLEKFGPIVKVLGQAFSRSDYFRLLESSDAVLLAYDPARYRLRTSHILVEALGAGRPVITTGGTWMEEELSRWGDAPPGVVAEHYNSDALGQALLTFEKNQSAIQHRAWQIAPEVRKKHNAAAFISALLA